MIKVRDKKVGNRDKNSHYRMKERKREQRGKDERQHLKNFSLLSGLSTNIFIQAIYHNKTF